MSNVGLDWYKREPVAYLGDTQGLTCKQHAVYSIVLDLIYQHGGSINNDPKWISGWISDMGAAAVRRAISDLVERGTLMLEGEKLTQKRAKTEAKTKQNRSETNRKNGKKGGEKSAEIRRDSNNNKGVDEPNATSEIQAEKRREEKINPQPPKMGANSLAGFDDFWDIWPNKTGKEPARKAWKRLSADDRREATRSAQSWFSAWRAGNPHASAIHPASYLNQKRWEDEQGQAAARATGSEPIPLYKRMAQGRRMEDQRKFNLGE